MITSSTLHSKSTHPMPDLQDYMTTEDAAKVLGLNVAYVRRMLQAGDLEGIRLEIGWLVLRKSVEAYKKKTAGMSKNDPRRGQ